MAFREGGAFRRGRPLPAEPLQIHRFRGVDDTRDATRIAPDFCAYAKNAKFDGLILAKRDGYKKRTTTAFGAEITGGVWFQKADDTTYEIWSGADGQIKTLSGTTWTSRVSAPYTANKPFDFVVYLDKVYGGNGQDGWVFWNGSGTFAAVTAYTPAGGEPANLLSTAGASVARLTKPKHPVLGQNRIYCLNDADRSIVYVSDLTQGPSYFPEDHAIKVATNDGTDCVALHRSGLWMLIFKERSIWACSIEYAPDEPSFRQFPVDTEYGCVAPRTVRSTPLGVVFLSHDGVRVLTPRQGVTDQFNTTNLSDPWIRTTMATFTAAQKAAASAMVWRDRYLLAIGGRWLVYNLTNEAWETNEDGWTIGYGVFMHDRANDTLYFAGSGGHVYEGFTGTSDAWTTTGADGAAIAFEARTAWVDMGSPELEKLLEDLFMLLKTSSVSREVTVTVLTDLNSIGESFTVNTQDPSFLLDTDTLDSTAKLGPITELVNNKKIPQLLGRRLMVKVTESSTAALELNGFTLYHSPSGTR